MNGQFDPFYFYGTGQQRQPAYGALDQYAGARGPMTPDIGAAASAPRYNGNQKVGQYLYEKFGPAEEGQKYASFMGRPPGQIAGPVDSAMSKIGGGLAKVGGGIGGAVKGIAKSL